MELLVVGCSGSASGPDSPASCYLASAPYEGRIFTLVLDLGPGAFGALYRYLDPSTIDAIGLSHLHPDHCLDLTGFYVAASYSATAPWPRIPVLGPAGTAARIAAAYEVPGAARENKPGIADRFDYRTWQPTQQLGPFTVTTIAAAHPVDAYSVRLTDADGHSLVFTGDTGPHPALAGFARGADLLLAEAAFLVAPDNPPGVHLSGADAATVARDAGVGRLVLTHIPAWNSREQVRAEATSHFAGPIDLAAAGRRFPVGGTT